ncbi:PLP-dependent aminotransferase family protein [Aneurinibacillus terranovensis]|uniref:aminotransferase-like domain-containing protein n=1 Tax=Aneurinibacillus terranovensis TaxID=278991 RepID=UPI0004165121|nr:PLP-dependent aminotransferase family protein [Aneurinibacillus terranovensis]
MKLDRESSVPLFRQIASYFEKRIINGELSPGMPLPPERKLAEQVGVHRDTITAAYEELRAAGLIQSVRGSGTRVSEHLWGLSLKSFPNWHQYTNGGFFLPTRPLVKRMKEAGKEHNTINLAGGEPSPDLLPSKTIDSLLRQLSLPFPLGYPDPKGEKTLRRALSAHLMLNYGITADPDEILITSGAQQALLLIAQCLLRPGDAIAMEGPSYTYSLPLFASAGLRLFRLPLDEQGLLPDEVVNVYRKHRIRMVFTNPTYQNPTGTTLSLTRRKQLLTICEELRLPIVEDDAYGALTLGKSPAPPPPLHALNRQEGMVMYVGSLSKTVAPGIRIGWIIGSRAVIERLADAKQQMDFGTSAILQQLAQMYLSSTQWETHVKELRASLTFRRDAMLNALEAVVGDQVKWTVPSGSYHMWCRIPWEVDEEKLMECGIKNGVLFSPGGVYGAEKGFVRLTFAGADEATIEEGIRRFGRAIRSVSS